MLSRLYQYAKNKNLRAENGFEPVAFRFAIARFDGQWSAIPLGLDGDKRGKLVQNCPMTGAYVKKSTKTDLDSDPFRETMDIIFNIDKASKNDRKRASFIRLLEKAASVMPILGDIAKELQDTEVTSKLATELSSIGAKPTDKIAIEVDGCLLVESPELIDWWRNYYGSLVSQEVIDGTVMCYASGEMVSPIKNYTPIKGLGQIGATASVPFLSCKKDIPAFSSYGLTEGGIRGVGEEAWQYVLSGLQDLISKSIDLRRVSAKSRNPRGLKMLYFYSKEIGEDLLRGVFGGSATTEEEDETETAYLEQEAKIAITTCATGKGKMENLDATYCLCLLSGNKGRLRIQRWLEGNLSELTDNVAKWQEDTALMYRNKVVYYGYWRLILALSEKINDRIEWPSNTTINDIFIAIVSGTPLGIGIPLMVLNKLKLAFTTNKADKFKPEYLSFIKTYLIRKGVTMSKGLQEDHPSSAYQLGRLLAILQSVQELATNGNSVIRRFSKACVSPSTVFPQIIGDARSYYLAKLSKKMPGLAVNFNKEIKAILDGIEMPFSGQHNSNDQMLFCLGYYHRTYNPTKKEAASKEEKDETAS
jgi:CRISPR-associated protein Cas8c/Csd1 subtype I-C